MTPVTFEGVEAADFMSAEDRIAAAIAAAFAELSEEEKALAEKGLSCASWYSNTAAAKVDANEWEWAG